MRNGKWERGGRRLVHMEKSFFCIMYFFFALCTSEHGLIILSFSKMIIINSVFKINSLQVKSATSRAITNIQAFSMFSSSSDNLAEGESTQNNHPQIELSSLQVKDGDAESRSKEKDTSKNSKLSYISKLEIRIKLFLPLTLYRL